MNFLFRKARILIVEDQKIIALDLASTVKRAGHDCIGIEANGERAIRTTEELKPDLVLMDISLSGNMDGIEAAEIIYNRFKIPVIFISGNYDAITIEKSRESMAYGYLVKPVEDCSINTIINTAIYRYDTENYITPDLEK